MRNKYKKIESRISGITLISLVISVIVLIILASVGIYSGISAINSSKLTRFTTQMKLMQLEVNELYTAYTTGGSIKTKDGNEYIGKAIATIGKDLNQAEQEQLESIFKTEEENGSGILNREGYRYFDIETIKNLEIEGIDEEFLINIEKRSIISYEGLKYDDKIYYTLEQVPDSLYNVDYENPNTGKPTFNLRYEKLESGKWKIIVSDIRFEGEEQGFINKWQVKYQYADTQEPDKWNISENLEFIVNVADEYRVVVFQQGVESESKIIVVGTAGKTLVQAFKDGEIEVGDYITDYNQKLKNSSASVNVTEKETGHVGTQTYRVDTSTTWRVLGLSEDGTQLIITTGSPIKKVMNSSGTEEWERDPYLYLNSAEGYYNTNDDFTTNNILDKICKIYDSTLADKTQSMRIEDINTAVGLTLDKENNIMYKTADETKTPIQTYQGFFGQTYTYKLGDYAPENYLKEKYPSEYTSLVAKKANDTVEGTAFFFSYEDSSVIDSSSKLYDILFKGTTTSENNAKSYWLASSGAGLGGVSGCVFGPGAVAVGNAGAGCVMFISDGYSREEWLAVRPVVYLRSDVTVNDLTINESGTEERWTTSIPNSYSGEDLEYGQITN